jgi:hypothetical protein
MARRFLNATPEKLAEAMDDLSNQDRYLDSSALQSARYNFMEDSLTLVFQDGSVYTYDGVDLDTYVSLLRAPSKGAFFNANIRDVFPFTRGG